MTLFVLFGPDRRLDSSETIYLFIYSEALHNSCSDAGSVPVQIDGSSNTLECPQLVVSTLHYRETPRWAAAGDKIWSTLLPAASETRPHKQI